MSKSIFRPSPSRSLAILLVLTGAFVPLQGQQTDPTAATVSPAPPSNVSATEPVPDAPAGGAPNAPLGPPESAPVPRTTPRTPPRDNTLETTVVQTAQAPRPTQAAPAGVSVSAVVSSLHSNAPLAEPGKPANLVQLAPSASAGRASGVELLQRPYLRRGELLEIIPGMIITQHSGGGKANQYFLRGYNLDHGTDFAIFVDNMPVNQRSHAHGQGYADINFIIPELVEELEYVKGPYFARFGDFSTAGAARFKLYREMPEGIGSVTWGTNNWARALVADSVKAGEGVATYALDYQYYDGPWVNPDALSRWNGFFRYVLGDDADYLSFTLMGNDASWNATDQIPSRLVQSGGIGRFGFIDPTNGGTTSRTSISADFRRTGDSGVTVGSVYGGSYQLDLFSNFTYFLNDPVNGDQFNQADKRRFLGASIDHTFDDLSLAGRDSQFAIGMQTHHDFVDPVGLHNSVAKQRLATVREDQINESSVGAYGQLDTKWSDQIRTQVGLRGDLYRFDVNALTLAENSGTAWDAILSPKAGIAFTPIEDLEIYLNGGFGFHSNDARGVTITVDPSTGLPADPVPGLVQTKGAEIGLRNNLIEGLTSTLALWYLESDSELVYVGDAGNTEAGDASERYGVEWSNYWRPYEWLTVDTELALSRGRFVQTGEEIINSVPVSFAGGVTLGRATGYFGTIRTRYFSPRPLTGDGLIESSDALQFNARLGWRSENSWQYALEVSNLFNAGDNDIEYYYESQLPGEAAGVEDIHFHPYEPRQFRFTISKFW